MKNDVLTTTIQPAQWLLVLANTRRENMQIVAEMIALDFAFFANGDRPAWRVSDLPH